MNAPGRYGFHLDDQKKTKQVFRTANIHKNERQSRRPGPLSIIRASVQSTWALERSLNITRVCSFWGRFCILLLFLFLLLLSALRNLHVKGVVQYIILTLSEQTCVCVSWALKPADLRFLLRRSLFCQLQLLLFLLFLLLLFDFFLCLGCVLSNSITTFTSALITFPLEQQIVLIQYQEKQKTLFTVSFLNVLLTDFPLLE